MRAFALENGLDHASISRWKTSDPGIEAMRQVAATLNMRLGEVLIIAGYGTPDDFGGIQPTPPAPPNVAHAIEYDPSIPEILRTTLRSAMALYEGAMPGPDGRTPRGGKRTIRIPR